MLMLRKLIYHYIHLHHHQIHPYYVHLKQLIYHQIHLNLNHPINWSLPKYVEPITPITNTKITVVSAACTVVDGPIDAVIHAATADVPNIRDNDGYYKYQMYIILF
eukprot:511640_1